MSFFDKLKQGVSDASSKAKSVMEVTRLKSQISAKQKEIDKRYIEIGQIVFRKFTDEQSDLPNEQIRFFCGEIVAIQKEIAEIDAQIREISNEKECRCGAVVTLDTRFCPQCGFQFPVEIDSVE